MGLSYTEPTVDIDLKALLGSGTDFQKRITELGVAKAQHDQALADLNLGKAAKEALADAQAIKDQTARDRASALEFIDTEVAAHKLALQRAVDQATAANNATMTKAATHLADASVKHAAAQEALERAGSFEKIAKAKADDIINTAQTKAKDILDKANAEASAKTAEADRVKKETDKALAIAKDAVDKHQKALSLLTAAANQIGNM